jgi:hypothetical protein
MYDYYVYAYLREKDNTPYYIGKGKGKRAFSTQHIIKPPKDKSKIIFYQTGLLEVDAHKLEIQYIKLFGRKELKTGILRNMTNGGEGGSGAIRQPITEETRIKLSMASKLQQREKVLNGTHHLLDGEIQRKSNIKRTNNGTHNFLGPKINLKRLMEGNHNFQGPDNNLKRLMEGTHPSQIKLTCPHCNKIYSKPNAIRYHFDKCKFKILNIQ